MYQTEKRAMVLNYQECTSGAPSISLSFLPSLSLSLFLSIEKCYLADKLPYTPAAAWLVVLLSAQKLPPV